MTALGGGAKTSGAFEETREQFVKTGPVIQNTPPPASYNTAGVVTYLASDIIGSIVVRDPGGAPRTDVLPSAALMVQAMGEHTSARIGDTIWCLFINGSSGNNTITLTGGSGGTLDANQNSSKEICIRLTNVTKGSEAYVFYC
jgi:hypothetical protein